jgi:peptide/nickel transport system substrate-binding protein
MRRRDLIKGGLATVGMLAAPALVRASEERELKFVPQADLALLDPISFAYVTRHHALMVFDTLYGIDEKFQPVPQMVEGAAQEDEGWLWRFTLRPGLVFHDGEPVRSQDCIASLRRWAQGDAIGQTFLANLEEMTIESDRVFAIRLKQPFPLLEHVLGKLSTPLPVIMPERLANQPVTARLTEMIGSGPFRFKGDERIPGARNVYERFAGYRPRESGSPSWTAGPKIVHFDRVEWLTMPDIATVAGALQRGEIDWWEYASSDLMPVLRQSGDVRTALTSSLGFVATMALNPLHPPMDNPAFRRVLLSAFNQADFMTAVAGTEKGMWRDGVGLYTPDTPYATNVGMEDLTSSSDVVGLKRALGASGYKGEKVVLMGASDLAIIRSMSDVADDMLRKIGVNVDYQMTDWGTLLTRRQKREPVDQGGWSLYPTAVDGVEQITPLTHRFVRALGPKAPSGWLRSPELESIWNAFVGEPNDDRRKVLAEQLQVRALREVPSIPLGQYMQNTALRKNLVGRLDGATLFWNLRRSS